MSRPVLVLGGYGVFGGKLARRLAAASIEVVVAGRSVEKAQAHCAKYGGLPLELDRDGDLDAAFEKLKPFIVVDAAGPFQAYGGGDPYRVARAAIRSGAHYLDLADDAAFVAGIAALDAEARAAGLCLLSGASTVPAISSTVLDRLVDGLVEVVVVGSAILPGNRAPRGLSVVRAIVAQAGQPLRQWRGGRWETAPVWGDLGRVRIETIKRLASRIGAPDLLLFPDRYRARSVLFHAGIELKIMHVGLWLLAWPVRLGLARTIEPLSGVLKWVADRLERFGSDEGGMLVYAIGRDAQGVAIERRWSLFAEAGDGPETPPTPALLIALALIGGREVKAGAGPAIGVLTLDNIEAELSRFRMRFSRSENPAPPLFEKILPGDFSTLPAAWRRLAEVHDVEHFDGEASVERGAGLLSRLVGRVMGFPPAATSVPVHVRKEKTASGETWVRDFGGKRFRSNLSRRDGDPPGVLHERFGPMKFRIGLQVRDGRVEWPVEGWSFRGIPMPAWLRPLSESAEFVDEQGFFHFDVGLSLPLAGFIVRYRGWLEPSPPRPD